MFISQVRSDKTSGRLTALSTFSKIAYFGFSLNKSSHAARNVSPEHPISSMSIIFLDLSAEKFLQLVPATKRLCEGRGTGLP